MLSVLTDADPLEATLGGLQRAYREPSGLWADGPVLYVAGTRSARDVLDDVALAFDPSMTRRYKDVVQYLAQHPAVHVLVGHSLGAAVLAPLSKRYTVIGFGSPISTGGFDFASPADPVAYLSSRAFAPLDNTGFLSHTVPGYVAPPRRIVPIPSGNGVGWDLELPPGFSDPHDLLRIPAA